MNDALVVAEIFIPPLYGPIDRRILLSQHNDWRLIQTSSIHTIELYWLENFDTVLNDSR